MTKQLGTTRTAISFLLTISCIACTPAKQATVQPQPDQVLFFERPLTLAAARKSNEPSPLVVLLERDPWLMVVGSDSPAFALYEDGTVIRRTSTGFRKSRLTGKELGQLLAGLNLEAMPPLYGRYEAEDSTDQPEQDLLIYQGNKPVFISVYGSLDQPEVRSKIPKAIVAAYDALKAFDHSPSREWLPDNIEVMVWPYEYAPEPSIKWPEEWPGLNDPNTVERGESSFSIYMPSARLGDVRAFLDRRSAKGAVEIDGRKWSASIRFPFPQEKLWMAPHPELDSTKR